MDVDQSEIIRVLGPLAFRATDKLFKFVTWAGTLVFLKYTQNIAGNTAVHVLYILASWMFGVTLLLQAMYLGARDPVTMGIPPSWRLWARPTQIIGAFVLISILSSPLLYIDQIVDALARARAK